MTCLRIVLLLSVFTGMLVACGARGEELPCRNLVIHMNNSNDTPSSRSYSAFDGEGTAVFVCNGSELEVRDQVSIHMMTGNENGVCYTDYSCGNLDLWSGSFLLGAQTMNASLWEFLCSGAWKHMGVNAPHVSIEASFDFLLVSRHCKPISRPVCVGVR